MGRGEREKREYGGGETEERKNGGVKGWGGEEEEVTKNKKPYNLSCPHEYFNVSPHEPWS